MKPLVLDRPIRLEIDGWTPVRAEVGERTHGVERVSDTAVAYTAPDMGEVARIIDLMILAGWHSPI